MYTMNSIKNILQASTSRAASPPTPERRIGCPHEMYCLFCPKCAGTARCPNLCPPGTPREPCPKHDMVVQGLRPSSKAPAILRAGRGPPPKGPKAPAKKPKAPAKKPKAAGFYPKYGRGGGGPKRGGAGGRGGAKGKRHPLVAFSLSKSSRTQLELWLPWSGS